MAARKVSYHPGNSPCPGFTYFLPKRLQQSWMHQKLKGIFGNPEATRQKLQKRHSPVSASGWCRADIQQIWVINQTVHFHLSNCLRWGALQSLQRLFTCVISTACGLVTKFCPTLCNPIDCSPPGFSVRGIFQIRTLEWAAISCSRESSWTRDQTHIFCTGRQILYCWATKEALSGIQKSQVLLYLFYRHTTGLHPHLPSTSMSSSYFLLPHHNFQNTDTYHSRENEY